MLSIIILSYNTKEILSNCLDSLRRVRGEVNFEVIVSDNGSSDNSPEMVEAKYPWVQLIKNKKNLGFAAGNNVAKNSVRGSSILFLNSDTIVPKGTLKKSLNYFNNHPKVAALTCKLVLPNGKLDPDTRRSFPTPWVALTHFSGLDRIFPKSKLLSSYWYSWISEDQTHEIDVVQGAFFMVRKNILDEVGWFDEDYFLDGEDIDLCWRIKSRGGKIVYYPKVSVTHIKKASKKKTRGRFSNRGVDAMAIFYKKHLAKRYPFILNIAVYMGIYVIKIIRTIKYFINYLR